MHLWIKKISYVEVASLDDINELLESSDNVSIELTEDLTLEAGTSITISEGKTVNFKLDSTVTCEREAFVVENAVLNLIGDGTIKATTKNANAAITAVGSDAVINFDGPTIDATTQGTTGNYAYGVYLIDNSSINFKSGTIKVGQGSCISSNNSTGGATVINVTGGELLSDGAYAIYSPAQEKIKITGGKVQGINARIGKIYITKDAEIIPTTITAETCDDIGANISTSGCIWFGDTIALIVGTYDDNDGTDTVLEVSGNAKVSSNFRSAIAIYAVDTLVAQNVNVVVADSANVTTTDAEFDAIKVYDHEAISEAATAAGKTYEAVTDSDITVNVDGSQVYPAE